MSIADSIRDEWHIRQLQAVETLADDLVALGVLPAKDATKALAAAERASHAVSLSASYQRHVEAEATRAGDDLAADDNLDLAAVIGAINLPSQETVDVTLARVWNRNTTDARNIAFANVHAAPGKLTERFDGVADEVLSIAAELGDVTDPQQALDAGLADQWQRLMQLKGELNGLTQLRTTLRSFGLIAEPTGSDAGWHWNMRHEYPQGEFKRASDRRAVDQGRALLILTAKCRPYCPASRAEAKATADAASRARQQEG